jgi:hypothetical protein
MAKRRCGTCGLWMQMSTLNVVPYGRCLWYPPGPRPTKDSWHPSMMLDSDGTDCPCWRPREEKGEQ